MATSHVTGAVAMMLALDPTLTVPEIKTILWQTADVIRNTDFIGYDLNLVAVLEYIWRDAGNAKNQKNQELLSILKRMVTGVNF